MQFGTDIKQTIGLDETDLDHLVDLRPMIVPHIDAIAADVADSLLEAIGRDGAPAGPPPEADPEGLHRAARRWLERLFGGDYGPEFLQARRRFGGVGLDDRIAPELLIRAANTLRTCLIEILQEVDPGDRRAGMIASVAKLVDLEVYLFWRAYLDDVVDEKLDTAATLASGLSHELYNPLNAITLNVTLLERQLTDGRASDERLAAILAAIRTETRRIGAFTGQLTDFTRPIHIDAHPIDAADFAASFQQRLGDALVDSGILFEVTLKGEPQLFGDRDRLHEATLNLLQNALEAVDGSGHIELAIRREADQTAIEVRDDGPGIEPGVRTRVFDLFFTTRAAGTGIGLPVAKKIVDAHGGRIGIDSEPGAGTRVCLSIPTRTAREAARRSR